MKTRQKVAREVLEVPPDQALYAKVVHDALTAAGASNISAGALRMSPKQVQVWATFWVKLRERRRGVVFCNGAGPEAAADWAKRVYEQELTEDLT